jgi:hypothetical protein
MNGDFGHEAKFANKTAMSVVPWCGTKSSTFDALLKIVQMSLPPGYPSSGFGPGKNEPLDLSLHVFPQSALAQAALAAGGLYNPGKSLGTHEKQRIACRLEGFNAKDTAVWNALAQKFGSNIKQPELLSIATVLSKNANVRLDRDAKRRKSVLLKWFEENWNAVSPYLDYVVLEETQA